MSSYLEGVGDWKRACGMTGQVGAKPVSEPLTPLSDSPQVSPEDGPGRARTCWVFSGSASPDKVQTRGCLCGSSPGSQAEVGAGPS